MVTLSSKPVTKSRAQSLGYDFALLGLKGREARVDVIRIAAERTASMIPDTLEASERVEMLAELAASTYRLLDPRRRQRPMERIILSLGAENDAVLATVGRQPLVASDEAPVAFNLDDLVVAKVVPAEGAVQLASKVAEVSVSPAGEEKPPRKPNRNPRIGLIGLSVIATLLASTLMLAWAILH